MRNFVKNDIFELIKTMYEAHNEAQRLALLEKYDEVQSILCDCQNAAINIGSAVEEAESEDCITINYLEDYCNEAFSIVSKLVDGSSKSSVKELLDEKLSVIEKSINNDIRTTTEVAFFPYNASMWDSLESIWKDYQKDPNVETYVIPIPYYDKNPDGTVKKWYYDIDKYPEYVPTIVWKEYDIKARHPDVVYIHNPYDDCNIVTSVHPDFYSGSLKKYTDELVYVPYFVTLGRIPDHLTQVPVIFNADKVLVANQEDKEAYINTFISAVGAPQRAKEEAGEEKNELYWEALNELADKRFIVFGSPKVRKLKETTKDQLSIPEEWTNLIKRPGKPDRTVILYNTSVSALLNNQELYLQKVASVINFVKDNDEFVLLWRPHPLLQSTLDAMMPAKADAYKKIVDDYKTGNYGIFDDSSEMTRAIVMSDIYYGDASSLIALFQETNKIAMIQNPKVDLQKEIEASESDLNTIFDYIKNIVPFYERPFFTLRHFLKYLQGDN